MHHLGMHSTVICVLNPNKRSIQRRHIYYILNKISKTHTYYYTYTNRYLHKKIKESS